MAKALIQFVILIAVFFTVWFLLGRINYVHNWHLEKLSARTEKQVGDAIIRTITQQEHEITNDSIQIVLNKIKDTLCQDDTALAATIKLHLIESSEVNAFSLPGNHIIVNAALVRECDSAGQLAGVLAHELAHIRLHHVMKKLGNDIGITLILSASGGNASVIQSIIRTMSSTAFERRMETQADDSAIVYLCRAGIDPNGLPDILEKMAESKVAPPEWISTHPDTQKRVEEMRKKIGKDGDYTHKPLTGNEWELLKDACTPDNTSGY